MSPDEEEALSKMRGALLAAEARARALKAHESPAPPIMNAESEQCTCGLARWQLLPMHLLDQMLARVERTRRWPRHAKGCAARI